MAAKLPSSLLHSRLNILQPKRFNTNHNTVVVTSNNNTNVNCNTNNLLNNDHLGNIIEPHLVSKQEAYSDGIGMTTTTGLSAIFSLSHGDTSSPSGITARHRPPNNMAKRNARERNRVKQVNQGFQTLRHHIPESYRMKKMSKVDTLRCALNYIRSLEKVLDISFSPENLKMKNSNFDIDVKDEFEDEDFSSCSISPTGLCQSQLDTIYSGGESCSDHSFVYGINESTTTGTSNISDHCHSQQQHGYVIDLVPVVGNTMMSHHQDEENNYVHHDIPMDENFKQEVEEHFQSAEII